MLQLNPPLPVYTPRGTGVAHLAIDYGLEHDILWVVALDSDGQFWVVPNSEVRARWNVTAGRVQRSPGVEPVAKSKIQRDDFAGTALQPPPNYGNSGSA